MIIETIVLSVLFGTGAIVCLVVAGCFGKVAYDDFKDSCTEYKEYIESGVLIIIFLGLAYALINFIFNLWFWLG